MRQTTFFILILLLNTAVFSQDYPEDFCNCEKLIINSSILGQQRELFIYLPNSYQTDTTKRFPVHYIADAPLSSNLYANLLKLHALSNQVPEGIVVGLSSNDREFNLHPDLGAHKYLDFIKTEVLPSIESNYRIEPFRILAGHSLSGDFAIYTLLKDPGLFNGIISGSPGPIDPIIKMTREFEPHQPEGKYMFFYSSIGSKEKLDTSAYNMLMQELQTVLMTDFHYEINKGKNHFSNLVINFQNAILELYQDWTFTLPEKHTTPVGEMMRAHYDQLALKFNYRPKPGEWEVIYPTMHQLAMKGDFENAIDVLEYGAELYPESDQLYAFLAQAYFDTGNLEKAKAFSTKSLNLNPENKMAIALRQRLPQN